jgi:hypothetical protein
MKTKLRILTLDALSTKHVWVKKIESKYVDKNGSRATGKKSL